MRRSRGDALELQGTLKVEFTDLHDARRARLGQYF